MKIKDININAIPVSKIHIDKIKISECIGRGTGGGSMPVQKDMYFSGKNAYIYACSKNGIKELYIYGHSEQDGIPAPNTPAEISSVGDSYLQLYVLDINHPDKGGQIFDFGDIKLRSLPNGVCDEIVYKNGTWKLIQRVDTYVYDSITKPLSKFQSGVATGVDSYYISLPKEVNVPNGWQYVFSNMFACVYTYQFSEANQCSINVRTIYFSVDNTVYDTIDKVKNLLADANCLFMYSLAEPIETILDLPKIEFSSETIYLLTNEQTIKPYLQGYYDVDLKISGKKLEYIKDGLMSWWQPVNLNNADKPNRVADKIGDCDLITTGFGYIAESGFNPTYVQLDGIDDSLVNTQKYEPESIKHVQITLSNISNIDGKVDAYCVSIFNYGKNKIQGVSNENIRSTGVGGTSFFLDAERVNNYPGTYDDSDTVLNIALQNTDDSADLKIINVGSAYTSYVATAAKERFYEAVAYNRVLSGEEIENNFLVSQVRNGVNIPDSVDPIDIIAERTYASGKKFPIYNTYRDRDNDNIESFKIMGYTVQNGTPIPEASIPLLSVGDEGLKLCISDSETGIALQVIDFGDIVLRSLPNGVCDSIEWDGTNWKHVQRIRYYIYNNDNIVKYGIGNIENTDIYYIYIDDTDNINDWRNILSNVFVRKDSYRDLSVGECSFRTKFIYFAVDNTSYTTVNEVKNWLTNIGASFIYELAEPVTTILEGIPAPQTFDEVTYFGTPSALVKPYMMCECKVKKALKYQGDISAWWYFGGNKSNETDRQIIDLSGNGNNLIPYNVIWTRESGFNQGWFHFDSIDDYAQALLKENIQANDGFTIQLVVKNFSNNIGFKTIAGFVTNLDGSTPRPQDSIKSIGNVLCIASITNVSNFRVVCNYNLQLYANNYKDNTIYAKIKSNTVINANGNSSTSIPDITDKSDNDFRVGYSGGDYFEVLLLKGYVNEDIIENNKKLLLQRNGVDGDINILLADSNGDLLTDSENYYLTSN